MRNLITCVCVCVWMDGWCLQGGSDGPVKEIASEAEFDAVLKAAGDRPVIIDFKAVWCGPCKMIAPLFHELAANAGDRAVFVSVRSIPWSG